MASIRLNFLPLNSSEFDFSFFRKLKAEDEKKTDNIFFFHLLENPNGSTKNIYAVSFTDFEGSESASIKSFDNIDLTKRFLLYKLVETLTNKTTHFKYSVHQTFTDYRLEFIIENLPEGKKTIYFSPYYLEDQSKFGFIIDYKFIKAPEVVFDKKIQVLSLSLDQHFRSNKNYYTDKFHLLNWFIDTCYNDWKNIEISLDKALQISNNLNECPAFSLSKKEYIFNNNNIAYSQFQGIKNYGPFKKIDQDVIFVFLFEERFKSFANELYLSLLGQSNPGTFAGFDAMFKIKFSVANVKRVALENYNPDNLKTAIDKVKSYQENGKRLIGIYIEDYDSNRESDASKVYYFLKYHFIQHDIPLQVVNYRNLGDKNSLKWSTSNIALAMFSKLGGIPWLVRSNNSDCLILGIGSSHKRDSSGNITKYFAYSVCLDSSGLYKRLEVLADEQNQENYLDKLQSNIITLLQSDLTANYKSCVLHLPFKIKHKEIKALSEAVKTINGLRFLAIKINTDNKFFGFSYHNTLVPYESNFIKLGHDQYLVWFEGLQFGKEVVDKRLSNPVHIQFLNLNKEKQDNEKNLLQDVLNLSGANWRGFNAKSIPISIYYSQIIASYLDTFEDLDDFNDYNISNEKPWFL